MSRKLSRTLFVTLLAFLFVSVALVLASGRDQSGPPAAAVDAAMEDAAAAPPVPYTYNTVITVTSGTDPDTSGYYTCYKGTSSDRSPCTLRRAIVEARGRSGGQLPVLIKFDIPQTPAEGYVSSLGVWELEPQATTQTSVFRRLKGQVIIDGDTQPGGRSNGPKIVIIGPETTHRIGFIVGDIAGDDEIIIRGLAMQHFDPHINVNTDDNVIEDCWFGLSSSGTTLSSGSNSDPEDGGGVALSESADDNVIRDNKFAGFFEPAAAIRGNRNTFTGNRVGMRANGTVPLPAGASKHPCSGNAWAGGSGITVSGDNHQIGGPNAADGNRFAGLYLNIFGLSEQPYAIQSSGTDDNNLIQNNIIGLDATGATIGICGRGIKLSGGPVGTQVLGNTIVETGLSAILMNDSVVIDRLNGNTLQGNTIKREGSWPGAQGDNTFPEAAIAYGSGVPDALRNFAPAKVTQVSGTAVSGTSGDGSGCPNCVIEIFLDDTDNVVEALQALAVATANGSGNWTASLPAPLQPGQGLRTMSTVPNGSTISGLDAGSTSNLSILYAAVPYKVFLPLTLKSY